MRQLTIYINPELKKPAYEQIYSHIKTEIVEGILKKGDKLPSSRGLANNISVSRSTVLLAYDQLVAEGYVDSIPKSGYFVNEIDHNFIGDMENMQDEDATDNTERASIDFSPGGIDTSAFPYGKWRSLVRQVINEDNKELFNSGNVRGELGLRREIADYLLRARGIQVSADRIILGAGNENLFALINILCDKQMKIAVENPVYLKSVKIFRGLNREIVPVPTDNNGLRVDELRKTDASIVYITPSHQYPLGTVMNISRRIEILNWAGEEAGRYIIEDDYDSEFRYVGKPIPALLGNDVKGKTIYIGTFSKNVSPAIRMAYMVLPVELNRKFSEVFEGYSNSVSRLDQKIMELFMQSKDFESHLNRLKKIYKNKHEILLEEIRKWKGVKITGANSGTHILLHINNGMSEEELEKRALKQGVRVYPLGKYYIGDYVNKESVILLGYAQNSIEDIRCGLILLKKIWGL